MNILLRGLSAAVVMGGAVAVWAGGLQSGDKTVAYQVNDITGPNKGKQLCYV